MESQSAASPHTYRQSRSNRIVLRVVPSIFVIGLGAGILFSKTQHPRGSLLAVLEGTWLLLLAGAFWTFQHVARWQLILTKDAIEVRDAFPVKPRRLRRDEILGFRAGGGDGGDEGPGPGRWILLVPSRAKDKPLKFYPDDLDVDSTLRDWVITLPDLDRESPDKAAEPLRHLTAEESSAVTSISGQMWREQRRKGE